MIKKKLAISLKFILIFLVVVLGTVPLVFMQTIVNRTVQENIFQNTTILTQGVLDQSHRYINLLLKQLDTHIDEIIKSEDLRILIDGDGLTSPTIKELLKAKNQSTVISSLVLVNLNEEEESVLITTGENRYKYLKNDIIKNFLNSQQAILLKENHSRILWLGTPPTGINDAIPSMWTYRYFKTEEAEYIIAASIDREELLSFLASISASSRSDVLLISSDNSIYPYNNDFFDYSFAAKALSRSVQGRFNILYDERETPDGIEKLMIQFYSDPTYFYNLIVLSPQRTLLRGFESIVQTTTLTLFILAVSSITLGSILVYFINKRINTFILAVYDIAKGKYKITLPTSRVQVQEDLILTSAILEMAEEIEKSRNVLKYANENLEQSVQERTAELKKSINELHMTRQSLLHSEKMAGLGRQGAKIAHEMSNPLSVAITASSHLASTVKEINRKFEEGKLTKSDFLSLSSIAGEVSEIIQRNLKHASMMTKGFKDFASDQSREERRTIRIKHYIEEIIKGFSYKLKKTSYVLELNCDEELEILTDPSIIYQTFTNLINNSILHGFEGRETGLINIQIESIDDQIKIIYKDDGKGISSENITQLYKPFFTTKADKGGTGLGLNIIKDLIEIELDGSIECTSTLGEGTQFVITFPISKE